MTAQITGPVAAKIGAAADTAEEYLEDGGVTVIQAASTAARDHEMESYYGIQRIKNVLEGDLEVVDR